MISADIVSIEQNSGGFGAVPGSTALATAPYASHAAAAGGGYNPAQHPQFFAPAKMNINVSPNPLGTVYATKRRRRSNKRFVSRFLGSPLKKIYENDNKSSFTIYEYFISIWYE